MLKQAGVAGFRGAGKGQGEKGLFILIRIN